MAEREIIHRVTLPIGPIHPALKEPISFRIAVDGEEIVDVDFRPGHIHRGIEWLGARMNWIQILYIAERICGICAWSHPMSYIQSVETACNVEVPERAEYIRVIMGELERIHSHILWAGIAGHEIGYYTILHYTWLWREKVLDLMELLTGNRVTKSMAMIGGVRRDIEDKHIPLIKENVEYYKKVSDQLVDIFLHDKTIEKRVKGCGILTERDALALCAVGPTVRGSGIRKDVRQDEGIAAYGDIGVKAVVPQDVLGSVTGDVLDRVVVRAVEVRQSAEIIERALDMMPSGDIMFESKPLKLLAYLKKQSGEATGRYEAPRGEVIHYVRAEESDRPARWKPRAPTLNNLPTCKPILMHNQIADIPIVIASIDPCFSCTDRVAIVDERIGETSIMTREELERLSRKKTEELR